MMRKQFSLLLAFALVALTASVSAAPDSLENFSGYLGGAAGTTNDAVYDLGFQGGGANYTVSTTGFDASTTAMACAPGPNYLREMSNCCYTASNDYLFSYVIRVDSWATTPTASTNFCLPAAWQDDANYLRGDFALNFYGTNGDLWLDTIDDIGTGGAGYSGGLVASGLGASWAGDGLYHLIVVHKIMNGASSEIHVYVDPVSRGAAPDYSEVGFTNGLGNSSPYGWYFGQYEWGNDAIGAAATLDNVAFFSVDGYASLRDAMGDVFTTYGITEDFSGVDSWEQFTH